MTVETASTGGSGTTETPVEQVLLPLRSPCRPSDWYLDRIRRRRDSAVPDLPDHRPLRRQTLLEAGVTRIDLTTNYVRVERGMYVHRDHLLPETATSGYPVGRRVHPATLVRAHAIANPGHLVTGFGAAALHGMRYFVGEEQLEFFVSRGAACGNRAGHLLLTRTRTLANLSRTSVTPDTDFPEIRCTCPAVTLARMLAPLGRVDRSRDRRWRVPDLSVIRPALNREFIRQVQISDAFHQSLNGMSPGSPQALGAGHGIGVDRAAMVLAATDVGAESPQETLLRLTTADLRPGLRSQIPVFRDNGSLLTVADLAWEDAGVYLFYDGGHHLQRSQCDHDSLVSAVLQHHSGKVLRVTAGQLSSVAEVTALRGRVSEALGR